MMSKCLTRFPIGGYRRTQVIPEFGGFNKNVGILLGGIFGECYSIPFGDGLVIVKPQPVCLFIKSFDV